MFPMHHLNKFYQLKKDEKSLRDRHKILDTLLSFLIKKKNSRKMEFLQYYQRKMLGIQNVFTY